MTNEFISYYRQYPVPREASPSMRILPVNMATVDARDGLSLAVHMMRGSWTSDRGELPYYHLFLRRYFWDQYVELSLARHQPDDRDYVRRILNTLRRILYLAIPYGVVMRIKSRPNIDRLGLFNP